MVQNMEICYFVVLTAFIFLIFFFHIEQSFKGIGMDSTVVYMGDY